MRKCIFGIAFLLASPLLAQVTPPANLAYVLSGTSWVPMTTTNSSGQIQFAPPAIALYCVNSGAYVPCTQPGGGGGSGTVTSVTFTGDGILDSATPSTAVTTSGAVAATAITQSANTILAGPSSGSAANPSFRALVNADFANTLAPTFSGANLTSLPAAAAGSLTGTTLASNVVTSSLTSAAGGSFGTAAYVATGTSGGTLGLLNGALTFSGADIFSAAGAASTPGLSVTGAPYTGGSTTTNFPQIFYNCTGATAATTLSASGTILGFNTCSGFGGNLIDAHANGGTSVFSVASNGGVTNTNGFTTNVGFTSNSSSGGYLRLNTSGAALYLSSSATGILDVGTTNGGTNGTVVAALFNSTATQSSVSCSTSGTAVFSEPMQGSSDKKVLIHMTACLGTASYTYPVAFTNAPSVYASNNVAASIATSVSTTAVTVTGATTTGSLVLEDY